MKQLSNTSKIYYAAIMLFSVVVAGWMIGCRPESSNPGLGAKPKADFNIVTTSDPNVVILVNKANPSIPYWIIPATNQQLTGDSAKVHFTFAGTYSIKMLAEGNGGLDSVTKTVTITQNDPTACQTGIQGFIASCSQKTWKLNPVAYATMVGPAPGDGSWWGNPAGDVTGLRACDYNDQYIFSFNAAGTFVYDNKGDFFDDGYMGLATGGCEPNANLTGAQKGWGSGTFSYSIIDNGGGKYQLKLNGQGAHIGLAKVQNGGEYTSGPVNSSITYDILSMTHDPGGFDLMQLSIQSASGTFWTFTLRSY